MRYFRANLIFFSSSEPDINLYQQFTLLWFPSPGLAPQQVFKMRLAFLSRNPSSWGLSLVQGSRVKGDAGTQHADPLAGDALGTLFWLSVHG